MKFLNPPIPEIRPEEIFEGCVQSYTDLDRKKRLLACKHQVEVDSASYQKLVPNQINEFVVTDLPEDVSSTEMTKVYDEKFARADAVGRKYYDMIMAQVERGICPICGVRLASTLDHYLPKAKVPTLSVTPSNLVPACRDCNMDKHTDMALAPDATPVHLYYDRLPEEPWLHVRMGDNLEITYYISCPDSWEASLKGRVEGHLDIYKLHKLYSAHAATEIGDKKRMWKRLVDMGLEKEVFNDICEMRSSAEANDLNSWKSALYRGLEKEFTKVKAWLFSDCLELV